MQVQVIYVKHDKQGKPLAHCRVNQTIYADIPAHELIAEGPAELRHELAVNPQGRLATLFQVVPI